MPDTIVISGDSALCAGHSYFYWDNRYIANFNYLYDWIEWQIPTGLSALIWYQEGFIAIVNVDSLAQSDTLKARWVKNGYGVGQWSPFPIRIFPVTLDAPEAIYGPDSVCLGCNASFHVNQNPDATSYEWSLPSGFNIIFGESSESISVHVDSSALSGLIMVKALNECRESPVVIDSVFLKLLPQQINITNETINSSQVKCFNATQTITVAGNGTSFVVQPGGIATMIAGQNIVFLPTMQIEPGGYLHGYITTTNEYCSPAMQPFALVQTKQTMEEQVESEDWLVKVYPNPVSEALHLTLNAVDMKIPVKVSIYNLFGSMIFSKELIGKNTDKIPLTDLRPGMYFLHVTQGGAGVRWLR